ncbi:MAG: flagellar basal body-associated FliL family protein [Betaproteobacteria bacterium]|nr:flagellar basal body-associated FliL family protein [Betaproteobacteria bacterium]
MAKAPDKQEAPPVEAAPKKKKLLLIIVVGLVLALVVGGGAAFILLKKRANADPDAEQVKPEKPPTFVKLDPFTVKLQPEDGKPEQYMQTTPELKVLDSHVAEKAKVYMPEIRHNMLLLLSGKKPSELSTPQGMEKLSMEIRNKVNQILGGEAQAADNAKVGQDDPVQAVLFSTFIIQ